MLEINASYIPKLADNFSIQEFDKNSYIICIDDNTQPTKFKVSAFSKLLLDQIDGKRTLKEITDRFNDESGNLLVEEQIINIFENRFKGYGVLRGDATDKIRIKDNYLKLRLVIFPRNMVVKMVLPFLFLFNKKVFISILMLCVAFNTFIFFRYLNLPELYLSITPNISFWFIVLNVISILFHELGHAGACEKFGANSGAIGFGFYLFTPVFYADVSDAWRLSRDKRLIVDLAGIYMQVIFCMVMLAIFLVEKNLFYIHIAFLITATTMINLNPFLRYDGYWALCDLLNVANLRENSLKLMKQFFRWVIRKRNTWDATLLNIFLMVYALSSSLFIVYFLFVLIFYQKNSILHFPVFLYHFFETIFYNINAVTFDWLKLNISAFILPFLFYFFLYRLMKKYFFVLLKPKQK